MLDATASYQRSCLEAGLESICAYTHQATLRRGGGSATIWACVSYKRKLDLVTMQGTLAGEKYRNDNLYPIAVLHFDNHPISSRPVYTDDNTRPHIARVVVEFPQQEVIDTPTMATFYRPDLNSIEHL